MSYGDEYYCPNCGATLNDQYGFDPDKGSWTCTECGQHLMDDDIYDGDTFIGVEWRCDCCNALLNRQFGFSDSLGSWTCTKCGHTNGISEDNIIDESDIVRCPNCGGVLNTQFDFSDYDNDCECSFCGTKLHRDYTYDDFEIVKEEPKEESPECPNCGAKLKSQWEYNDWNNDYTCSDCGAVLHRDYSSDDFEIVENKDDGDNDFECPNCYAKLNEQDDFYTNEEDWTYSERGVKLHLVDRDDEYEVVEEKKEHSSSDYTSSHRSTSKSSKSNDWLLFFLCLFLGYFGVHKFAEGKVGMGILYIFTVGLFYIGWFVDIVKYFKRAITSSKQGKLKS